MDTKLKDMIDYEHMSERTKAVFLVLLVFLESILLTFAGIFSHYSTYYAGNVRMMTIRAMLMAVAAVLLGIYLVRRTVQFLHRYQPVQKLRRRRIDRIPTEFAAVVFLTAAALWLRYFFGATPYLVGYGFTGLIGVIEGVVFSVRLLPLLFVFYGSLALLLRQWLHGIMPESSLIWSAVRRYRERTALEKRLQNRSRFSLILAILALTVGVISGAACMGRMGEMGLAAVLCIMMLFILFLRVGVFGRLSREAGCLAKKIQCMTDGTQLPPQFVLREKALLYEAFAQLENIDSAMRQSIEKQVQAERLKVDLITNVSHDLKTPLTSMVGYTDLLKKEELSAEARDYVEIISQKQEQLKNMIQDLFDLSKATSGADQMAIETLDMRRLLEQTLGDMEDVIQASGREVRTHYADAPLKFLGDNNKMYRVVQNLLENALKYSLEGTRVYVDAAQRDGSVEFQIKNVASYEMDFSPDEITERFVRGDKARTTEGHGLGLAIASSFVRNMGGTLEIDIDGDLFRVTVRIPGVPS